MTGDALSALSRRDRDEDDEVAELLMGKYGLDERDAYELIADARRLGSATVIVDADQTFVTIAPDAWGLTIASGTAVVLRPDDTHRRFRCLISQTRSSRSPAELLSWTCASERAHSTSRSKRS